LSIRNNIPLCIDLDGTLVKTDMLMESLILLIKSNPLIILFLPIWLMRGLPYFKDKIFSKVSHQVEHLPYNLELIEYAKNEKANGRKIILVTASPQSIANSIGEFLGIFDEIYGTQTEFNLKGSRKSAFLVNLFGEKGFVYAGDSNADLKVWLKSYEAIIISNSSAFISKVMRICNVEKVFGEKKSKIKLFIKQIRVYQWVKNVLILLPIAMAHNFSSSNLMNGILAFVSFSLAASSVYVLNDLFDLSSDRAHPRKKKRPFASGDIPLIHGFILTPLLIIISYSIGFCVNIDFILVLSFYLFLTTLYSFKLKKIVAVDIIILASLYTIRLIAGSVATEVFISKWLLAFSMFTFFGLALLKRYTELLLIDSMNKTATKGRGYYVGDSEIVLPAGIGSGLLAVLVFALYVNSPEVIALYNSPTILWLIAPLLLFWVLHVWLKAKRGEMTDDPIVFTVKDRTSQVIGLIAFLLIIVAKL